MSSVSNINLAMSGSSYGAYSQKLTQATKSKLEELGITYNQNTTEAQAQQMIKKFQAAKDESSQNLNQNQDEQSSASQQDSNKERLINLAEQIGLTVDEKATFNEIAQEVELALEEKIKASSDNQAQLLELKSLSRELASIQAQAQGGSGMNQNTNQALMMSLEMLSMYNKNFLNQ